MLQLGTQPAIAGHAAFDIETVRPTGGLGRLCLGTKAQFKHEPGMTQQKEAQLRAVRLAFTQANEKSFDVGPFGMRSWAALVASSILLIDLGP